MAEVYCVNIDGDMEHSLWIRLIELLPKDRKEKIDRLKFLNDKKASLFAYLLIYYYYKVNKNYNDLSLCENLYGKPFLKNNPDNQFNISHSGNWVVCGFGQYPLGIDIEKTEQCSVDIVDVFFHEVEKEELNSLDEYSGIKYFYYIWTLKEAYLKTLGVGITIPMNSFYFGMLNSNITLYSNEKIDGYHFFSWDMIEDYQLSFCINAKEPFNCKTGIRFLDRGELIKQIL